MLWVRYEDLLAEPLHEVRRVAEALRSPLAHDDAALRAVVEAASFAQMKERHERTEGSASKKTLAMSQSRSFGVDDVPIMVGEHGAKDGTQSSLAGNGSIRPNDPATLRERESSNL